MRKQLSEYTQKETGEALGDEMNELIRSLFKAQIIAEDILMSYEESIKNNGCDICFLEATIQTQIGMACHFLVEYVEKRMDGMEIKDCASNYDHVIIDELEMVH